MALRKQPTEAQRALWRHLRGRRCGVKFRRQHPYLDCVLDFVCLERKLVVAVDGAQHAATRRGAGRDRKRPGSGFRVLRSGYSEALNEIDAVLEPVFLELDPSPPKPSP